MVFSVKYGVQNLEKLSLQVYTLSPMPNALLMLPSDSAPCTRYKRPLQCLQVYRALV